jgi:starvation-inducible DNA-binding protein
MTDVKAVPTTTTNADGVTATAQYLAPVVVGLTALAVDGKQAHWHVRGENFIGVHELLDDVVDHAREWADLAAERVVALGLPLDARIGTVAATTKTPEFGEGFQQSDSVVAQIVAQIDAVLADVRTAVDELAEVDQTSQDIAIEIARGLDKDRWFLFAHIAK